MVSKMLYGLSTAGLNASERRRLDGLQARCLSHILGIQPAFILRVYNAAVLERASQRPLTKRLLKDQLRFFGQVARAPSHDSLRRFTFCNGSLRPATDEFIRKVGRPKNEWAKELTKDAVRLSGGIFALDRLIFNKQLWEDAVHRYCA